MVPKILVLLILYSLLSFGEITYMESDEKWEKNVYIFYVAAPIVSHMIENKLASLITVYFCFISLLMGYKEDLSTLWSQQKLVESLIILNKNHFMRMIREYVKTFPIFSGSASILSILKYFQ